VPTVARIVGPAAGTGTVVATCGRDITTEGTGLVASGLGAVQATKTRRTRIGIEVIRAVTRPYRSGARDAPN
jgi:hypothetical protein